MHFFYSSASSELAQSVSLSATIMAVTVAVAMAAVATAEATAEDNSHTISNHITSNHTTSNLITAAVAASNSLIMEVVAAVAEIVTQTKIRHVLLCIYLFFFYHFGAHLCVFLIL